MGERKDMSSVAAAGPSSRRNHNHDVVKQKSSVTSVDSLPEGWEIRHSRSRNGKVYYVNTITKVSTWKNPNGGTDKQARSAFQEVKLKTPRHHPETKQPVISQLKEKQVLPVMTATVHSNKRKAENTASVDLSSYKVQKSSNVSTVQSESQCQKQQRNKTLDEKPIAKQLVVNSTAIQRFSSSQGELVTPQADKTSVQRVIKRIRKANTCRPLRDCSQNVSASSGAGSDVKDTVSVNNSPSCSTKTVTSGISSSDNKCKNSKISSLVTSSHLVTTNKTAVELDTSNVKQSERSHVLSFKKSPHNQSLLCNSGSVNIKESFHQENSPYLNKTSMGLTSQTCLDRLTYSHSCNSSHSQTGGNSKIENDPELLSLNRTKPAIHSSPFTSSSSYDARLYSSEGTKWKTTASTTNDFLDSGVCSNLNVTKDTTGWSPSPGGAEVEQDIEDMEVDEGLAILSNLQDVRTQTSSMLHEPKGVLTKTVAQAKSVDQSAAVDSTKDNLKKQIILVVDTNVLISCLRFLQDIMSRDIPGYQGIILVMPWVVMQELDYLKSRRQSINNLSTLTSTRASQAIKFIHSYLIENNSQLVGQTPREAAEKTDLPLECNDDRILQCCLQFEQKYPDSMIVLLTRDVNLINKAVIMGISAATNETLTSHLKLPNSHFGSRQITDTPKKTRKRSLKNRNIESSGTKPNDTFQTLPKIDTTSVCESASSTPCAPLSKKANICLPDKILPKANPTASEVSMEYRSLPQTDAEKVVVMDKFEAVWKLIHDMKSQIGVILAEGKSHTNYNEAVELLNSMKPLLSALKDYFSRCLYLSPVILWEHEAEFTVLSTRLNTFYAAAQTACVDPSQPVETVQLMKHFHNTANRSVLFSGLEQLSAFFKDVETLLRTCS